MPGGFSPPQPIVRDVRTINIPSAFQISEVDGHRGGPRGRGPAFSPPGPGLHPPDGQTPITPSPLPPAVTIDTQPTDDPSLGTVLSKFVGAFKGTGLNTIFRPNSNFAPNLALDNLLELNLTSETLQFLSGSVLGDVPNRGFDNQPDVFLRGIPYTQTISDKLNQDTGKADLPTPIGIHFEQGLFMRTPATTSPSIAGASITRMGSIPHGTTINAQAFEPTSPIQGKPDIHDISIVPFFIGSDPSVSTNQIAFPNMSVPGDVTSQGLRKPADLTKFIAQGTITIDTITNPNKVLKDINAQKNIVSHLTFTVATNPTDQLPGGGVANIGFLSAGNKGNPGGSTAGNANAVSVTCQYWVSTISHNVVIPAGDYASKPQDLDISPEETKQGISAPKFRVQLRKRVTNDTTVQVPSTQIQYSQNVTLNFGVLSWPHVSVATLIPAQPLLVTADNPILAGLK